MPESSLLFAIGLLRAITPTLALSFVAVAAVRVLLAASLERLQDRAYRAASGDLPAAPSAQEEEIIIPIVVKQSKPRSTLALLIFSAICLTYLLDGAVLIARAVVTKSWETELDPLASLLDWYIVGSFVAFGAATLTMAWQIRTSGNWQRGLPGMMAFFGSISEIALLVVLSLELSAEHLGRRKGLWPTLHLVVLVLRIILLLLALLATVKCFDRTTFEPIETDEQPSYGTFNGEATPKAAPKTAPTPPPTFRDFIARIRLLSPYLWPSKSKTLQGVAVVCILIVAVGRAVNLLVPQQLGAVISDLSDEHKTPWLNLGIYVGLRFLQGGGGILNALQGTLWVSVSQYADREMTLMCFNHLLNLSLAYHTKRKTGEVLRVLDRGAAVNNFFSLVLFSFAPMLIDLVVAVIYLGVVFGLSLAFTMLVVMVTYVGVSIWLTTYRVALRRQMNDKDKYTRGIHTDALLNWSTVKYFVNEDYEIERYRKAMEDYQRAEYKVSVSLNFLNLSQNFILSLGVLVGTIILAYRVSVLHTATVSNFVVFISYLVQLTGPLNQLGTLYRVVQSNLTDTDNLVKLLNEQKEIADRPDALELEKCKGDIEFDSVVFSYDGKGEALKEVSFKIPAGSSVAFVGESGGGKSTILRLLFRFYDVTSGSIKVDGHDIRDLTQASLRTHIGVVPQDAALMNASIFYNIQYGNPTASRERVIEAAKAAQIHERVMSFADGYDTVVGERGVRLSGGEMQRVALARVILRDPSIVLLDEATSALDTVTERHIQSALRDLSKGRTSLTIAHRLSTIINADIIFVLKDGRIAEYGRHAELVEKGGLFADLWQRQIRTEVENFAASGETDEPRRSLALPPGEQVHSSGAQTPSTVPGR